MSKVLFMLIMSGERHLVIGTTLKMFNVAGIRPTMGSQYKVPQMSDFSPWKIWASHTKIGYSKAR